MTKQPFQRDLWKTREEALAVWETGKPGIFIVPEIGEKLVIPDSD